MITVNPDQLLARYAPVRRIERLITEGFSVNKAILSAFADIDFIEPKKLQELILKAQKHYKQKYSMLRRAGETIKDSKKEAFAGKKLLVNRVQSLVLFSIAGEVKEKYKGERYRWLPSESDEPRPEHQLKYGKTYRVGVGVMPMEEHNCKCGMEILTDDEKLTLE